MNEMESGRQAYYEFRNKLVTYINQAVLSRSDYFSYLFFRKSLFSKNAANVIDLYHKAKTHLYGKKPDEIRQKLNIKIDVYKGKNPYVIRMMEFLEKNLKDDLVGAYMHGSLGTYEEVAFSDFDALAIIKDEVFASSERLAKVARKLHAAQSIMFEFDPLQHHGWFVLSNMELEKYPDYYFPHELFSYSKSLFANKGLSLDINPFSESNNSVLYSLIKNIRRNITIEMNTANAYKLKSLLSKVMLVPALYVQLTQKRGIYKKYSFLEAKKDFSSEEWRIVDDISGIRNIWDYKLHRLQKSLLKSSNPLLRKLSKTISPRVSKDITKSLTPVFLERINLFLDRIERRVNEHSERTLK